MKTYTELLKLESFSERLEYLKLLDNNALSPRHMSMSFYKSDVWRHTRQSVIDRDFGFDLGVFGVYIYGSMIVHHIEPIEEHDILYQTKKLLSLDNLITTSYHTHNLIHYRKQEQLEWVERTPGDTILW